MKTIYTAIPLAVLAAVAQAEPQGVPGAGGELGHGHKHGVHDFLGGNSEQGDFLGDTYDHDFLGDGFNEPHKKPHARSVPGDEEPGAIDDLPGVPNLGSDPAQTINAPFSGPHNFNHQKGPHTETGDNEIDDGINNDNIVITPVDSFQGQYASEEDDYIFPPPMPPHGGPPSHEGPPHGGPPQGEGIPHGPEQLPPGQHSEPQHEVPPPVPAAAGPPMQSEPKPEHAPGPQAYAAPAPPPPPAAPQQAPPQYQQPHEKPHPASEHVPAPAYQQPPQGQGEYHPAGPEHQETPCTFHPQETGHPAPRPQGANVHPPAPAYEAQPQTQPHAPTAPKEYQPQSEDGAPEPHYEQGYPKPLGSIPGGDAQHPAPAQEYGAHKAQTSSACPLVKPHASRPSPSVLPQPSHGVESHPSMVAHPSNAPSTLKTTAHDGPAAPTAPPKPSSTDASQFTGGAGSSVAPQAFAMAVVGALAFLL